MKSFNCKVERIDEFKVELDETILTEEWMGDFKSVYYDYETLEEHAEHIAQHRARFGRDSIEGYGVPLENGKIPIGYKEEQVNKAINIIVISEGSIAVDVD